jgi:hypothetical protein
MKQTFRKSCLKVAISATLLISLSGSVASAQTVLYSLKYDWSNQQNPNGAWSYNYGDYPIPVFQTFFWGQAGWSIYNFAEASILKGFPPRAGSIDPFGDPIPPVNDWRRNDVMMAAMSIPYGGGSTFVNVRWTSPVDGTINIAGRAWDGMISSFSGRDVGWALLVGGQTVAQRYSVLGLHRRDDGTRFDANLIGNASLKNIPVTRGEVVEFRVIANTYYGGFVGVEETIVFKPKLGSLIPMFLDLATYNFSGLPR